MSDADNAARPSREATPSPSWIPREGDDHPSRAMPQPGFVDWRQQAEWWERNAVYWSERAKELGRKVVAVEHFEGDGRMVDRVWLTYHWLASDSTPDQIDPAALVAVVPECIYNESGRALR